MSYWKGKCIVVTGGGGFLGSHVVGQLGQQECADAFVVRQAEYDLTHEAGAIRLFREYRVDVAISPRRARGGIGPNQQYPADYFYRI